MRAARRLLLAALLGLSATAGSGSPPARRVLDVVDFGARPDDDGDDTAAIQAAIDALPRTLLAGSARVRSGGVVYLPAGQYRLGGTSGRCSGGPLAGTACRDGRACKGGTCAAIVSGGHALTLVGAGPHATELVVTADDMAGIAIDPGDDFASVERLRLAKVSAKGRGTGDGIVIRGQRTVLRDLLVQGFGGSGIFLDGEHAVAKANACRFDRVESDGNGGDGFRIWSHDDGSMHTLTGCDAQGNGGWGFAILSSKNSLIGLETNGNHAGGMLIGGSHNVATSYFEIRNQPVCVRFEPGAEGNVVFDLSGCTGEAKKLVDLGRDNAVHVDGGWTAVGYVPTEHPEACDARRRGRTYYDAGLKKLCYCEERDGGFRWCPVDGEPCRGSASGCGDAGGR